MTIDAQVSRLYGLDVVINDTQVSERVLAPKRWHKGRCYAPRVNKKWRKRYGTKPLIPDNTFHRLANDRIIFMNSVTWANIKNKLPTGEEVQQPYPSDNALRVQAAVERVAHFKPLVGEPGVRLSTEMEQVIRKESDFKQNPAAFGEALQKSVLQLLVDHAMHDAAFGKPPTRWMDRMFAPPERVLRVPSNINLRGA